MRAGVVLAVAVVRGGRVTVEAGGQVSMARRHLDCSLLGKRRTGLQTWLEVGRECSCCKFQALSAGAADQGLEVDLSRDGHSGLGLEGIVVDQQRKLRTEIVGVEVMENLQMSSCVSAVYLEVLRLLRLACMTMFVGVQIHPVGGHQSGWHDH